MIKEVSARTAREALLSKGFTASVKGNRDHEMYFFELDGKKTSVFFKISFGASHVRRDEIRNSARAQHLRGDDFYSILCCDHSAATTRTVIEAMLAAR
ncbi:MAG: hypothetical protein JWN04_113 [Myxococcaceae bacterium]|nr:hypothetical protein [Myxococcaceae bacterium]